MQRLLLSANCFIGQRLSRSYIGISHTDTDLKELKEKEKDKDKDKDDAYKEGPPPKRAFMACKALVANALVNQAVGDIVTIGTA